MIEFVVKITILIVNVPAPRNLNGIIWEEFEVPEELENSNAPKPYKSAFNSSLQVEKMLSESPVDLVTSKKKKRKKLD